MAQPRKTEPGSMDQVTLWIIRRYTPDDARWWDERVAASRNATFLHRRAYMDYHADRFADCSLIALRHGKPTAILPANITSDGVLQSHGGLTYGGWILPKDHIDGTEVVELFGTMIDWCRANGIKAVDYRPLPSIYHLQPSDEDVYALFVNDARLTGCQLSSAINYAEPGHLNTLQRRHLRKATTAGFEIREDTDVRPFHAMLTDCLAARHNTAPVHTTGELQMLRDRFPDNIRIFTIHHEGRLMAGVTMYLTETVAHTQYIATTPEGRDKNMLTPLFVHLIELFSTTHRWFDFGTSNEQNGRILNAGLLRQKFSYGATGVVYQKYILNL